MNLMMIFLTLFIVCCRWILPGLPLTLSHMALSDTSICIVGGEGPNMTNIYVIHLENLKQ